MKSSALMLVIFLVISCGGGGGGDDGGSGGGAPVDPSTLDSDNDGVINGSDNCANTPAGATVDAGGCAASQLDMDADGVSDAVDTCPATPAGEAVDMLGCGTVTQTGDADMDGVADKDDACLMTPAGATVNAQGCAQSQLDSDGDSVSDDVDDCPDTPADEPADARGCGIVTQGGTDGDSDEDGISDISDDCMVTPSDELVDDQGCSDSQKDADMDGITNDLDSCDSTPTGEAIDSRGCGTSTEAGVIASAFIESNGIVVVEMESTNYPDGWALETGRKATGNAYLAWQGGDNFRTPGNGVISVPVVISSAGTYRFSWRNIITEGEEPTDFNDSWLQIEAPMFFGKKLIAGGGNDPSPIGHIVCPAGKPTSNSCVGDTPNGDSADGWLKVYRSGGPVQEWKWVTGTSDNDRHDIFADFDTAGTYNVLISGRSNAHGIDRFVLHRAENASGNISNADATSIDNSDSAVDISESARQ